MFKRCFVRVFDVHANVQVLHVLVFAGRLLSTGHVVRHVRLDDTMYSLSVLSWPWYFME